MSEQYNFFDGTPPHQKHSPTSREAAVKARDGAQNKRASVLHFITESGRYGATDEEIQVFTKLDGSTERPRRRELQLSGEIRDSGQTRETKSGRKAVVWVCQNIQ